MKMNLRKSIESKDKKDKKRGKKKIEWKKGRGNKELRKEKEKKNIDGEEKCDKSKKIVYILRSKIKRKNERNKEGMIIEMVRGVIGIEKNGSIEEEEKWNKWRVEKNIKRM